MQFSEFDLDTKLLNAIDKMGYETPTSIQQQAIPGLSIPMANMNRFYGGILNG